MDRPYLNKMLLPDLQQKVRDLGLPDVPRTRQACIDLIMDHLENNEPLQDAAGGLPRTPLRPAQLPEASAQVLNTNNIPDNTSDNTFQNAESMADFCSTMKNQMQQQQIQMETTGDAQSSNNGSLVGTKEHSS